MVNGELKAIRQQFSQHQPQLAHVGNAFDIGFSHYVEPFAFEPSWPARDLVASDAVRELN
jgi:hypothetical protein